MALIKCPQCGRSISDKAIFCPVCGNPNSTNTPTNRKPKGIIITASILLIVIIIGLLGAFIISKGKATVYYDNLETATYKMLDGAANAETAGNLIKSVWYNTIYENRDTATDKYTLKNGKFVDDFNDALSNLFSDEEFQKSISAIQNNQDEVVALMKQLKNPPKKYEEAYSVLKTYYYNYSALTNMVTAPTGSLQSFSDEFNDADTATVNSYEKMKLYLN